SGRGGAGKSERPEPLPSRLGSRPRTNWSGTVARSPPPAPQAVPAGPGLPAARACQDVSPSRHETRGLPSGPRVPPAGCLSRIFSLRSALNGHYAAHRAKNSQDPRSPAVPPGCSVCWQTPCITAATFELTFLRSGWFRFPFLSLPLPSAFLTAREIPRFAESIRPAHSNL